MKKGSLYLLFGDDEYLVAAKAKELVSTLTPSNASGFGTDVIDGRVDTVEEAVGALRRCEEAIRTPGFFDAKKVVWLRDATFLSDGRIAASERVKARVADLVAMIKEGLPSDTSVIVSCPKMDKRQAFYRACAAAGEVHEFSIPDKPYLVERQAMDRLREMLRQRGMTMKQDVAGAFADKVGSDTRRMANELEKLAVYMGGRKEAVLADIEILTSSSPDTIAWDLTDAVGKRDLRRSLELVRQLAFLGKKESPIGILISLEGRMRELMLYREALDKGWFVETEGYGHRGGEGGWRKLPTSVESMLSEQFAADPRDAHPYRMKVLADQAKRFSMRELRRNHRQTVDASESMVSSAMPPWMALEVLVVRMLAKRRS